LLWTDIDLEDKTILVRRKKSGVDSLHPLSPEERQQLTALHAASHGATHVFLTERGRPMQRQRVHEIVKRAGAGLPVNVHCHVLRLSTGYALIKARLPIRVQSFLGHAAISSMLVYAHRLDEIREQLKRWQGRFRNERLSAHLLCITTQSHPSCVQTL
jgi:integrase